jgi:hypothetical protein
MMTNMERGENVTSRGRVRKRLTTIAVATTVATTAFSLLAATPAAAASQSVGPRSCAVGSVVLRAEMLGAGQEMVYTVGGTGQTRREFPSSNGYITRTWYTSARSIASAYAYASGGVSNFRSNCAD